MMKILAIDDNRNIRRGIRKFFKKAIYVTETAENGKIALEKVSKTHYDVIILDLHMPVMGGKAFMQELKKRGKYIPVLVMTMHDGLDEKLEMFELGVDDYILKPIEFAELEARIKVIMNRARFKPQEIINIGDICINISGHTISKNSIDIETSSKEYLIIEYLAINKGFFRTKTQIIEHVWGEAEANLNMDSTTLETHISHIRNKLGKETICMERGKGYRIP